MTPHPTQAAKWRHLTINHRRQTKYNLCERRNTKDPTLEDSLVSCDEENDGRPNKKDKHKQRQNTSPLSKRMVDGVQKDGSSGNQIQSWPWDLDDAIEAAQGIQNTSFVIGDIDDLFQEAMTSIGIQLSAIQKKINAIKERYGVTNNGEKNEKSHCEDKHNTYTYTEAMMRADGEQQYNKTILFNKKCDMYNKKITALLEETRTLQCMLSDGMKSDASILALEER